MFTSNRMSLRHLSATAVAAIALSFSAACGDDFEEVEAPETCTQALTCEAHVFLQVDQFEYLRQNEAITVLDARNEELYADGHIPGALHGNWRDFVNPDKNGILWEDEQTLEDAAQALGINNDDTIAVYGAGDGSGGDSPAGRLYWTLQYLGHDDIYLVNGGLESWLDANYGALQAGATDVEPGDFTVDIRPERRATVDEVEQAIEDETLRIVDTRRMEEWVGDNDRNNPRVGYIPEAIHYHWEDVFDENNELRPKEEIRAELEELDIEPGTLTIPYCQSGVRSGFFYAVLQWLDYPDPKNYDGSWWEWSRDDDLVAMLDGEPSDQTVESDDADQPTEE